LDNKINDLKQKQKDLDDSISVYKKDIEKIDETIENIRSQKTVINNYYDEKAKEILGSDFFDNIQSLSRKDQNNIKEFIDESVSSILNQTYDKWELIIAINGHIENSNVYKIAKEYEKKRKKVLKSKLP
jgi:hypothetical protein